MRNRNSATRFSTLAGFAAAALIGVGSTFAWQAHLKSNDVAMTAVPAPVAAATAISPDVSKQLEALAQGISSELAVKQQQLVAAQLQQPRAVSRSNNNSLLPTRNRLAKALRNSRR